MADLTDLQSAGTTKIVGANGSGVETNPLAVNSDGSLLTKITDGTNTVAVTPPSTAPSASDPAIVVAISPNTAVSTNNNQGSPNTLANAWPVKVTDGTNVLGTNANPIAVSDGGSSLTVDGTVAATQSGTWTVQQGSPPWSVSQSGSPWGMNITQVGGSALALGQTTMASSIPVTLASNQSALAVSQSGTWTVQPGNTANTTPWLVTVSTALPTGANTIGAVTQASGPWTQNITQFGGSAVVTGTGASGSGVPRVTVANDSNILATQSGTWNVGVTSESNVATADYDTGAGTVTQKMMGIALPASGGPVAGGTSTNPIRVDPTGTTAQPITDNGGSLTVDNGGTFAVQAAQSGTWTVQPGNTANTTAWRVEGQKTSNSAAPSSNNLGVLPAVASTSAPSFSNGNQVALSTDLSGTLRVTSSSTGSEEATYTVIGSAVTPGNNKSMLAIYNPTGSAYVLKLREFYIRNAATSAVTGVVGNFELHRFAMVSAPAGGTNLTTNIAAHDSNDAIPASMRASTGDTISGEVAAPLDLIRMSTDEWGPGAADVESYQQAIANYLPARAKRDGLLRPFYMRAGEGIHIKFATNSTAGSIDVVFVFTKV